MLDDGQLGLGKQPLHHILVHARRRTQHTGADIGEACQFKKALDSSVLAKGAVQNRENHVQRLATQRRVAVERRFAAEAQRSSRWIGRRFRSQQGGPALGKHARAGSRCRIARPQLFGALWTGFRRGRRSRSIARQQVLRSPGDEPVPGLVDADGHHVKFPAINRLQNRSGRQQRNLMLAAAPAKKNAYAKFFCHFVLIVGSRLFTIAVPTAPMGCQVRHLPSWQ